mgnify:CR=1 FL=1
MIFNTFGFAVFFISFFVLYQALKKHFKIQNILLLIASYFFYGILDIRFLFLIILSSNLDYLFGLLIDKNRLSLTQCIKTSLFFLLSGFLFLIIQYNSIHLSFYPFSLLIDHIRLFNFANIKILIFSFSGLILIIISHKTTKNWEAERRNKIYITLSVTLSLTILGFFKYYNFFIDSFTILLQKCFNTTPDIWSLKIILPVGISFYIFKSISYTIDIYRKELSSCESLIDYSVYLAFFPQLLAGPIERAKSLIPQLQTRRPILTKDHIYDGLWLILWGLYKKMIADNLANVVNNIFGPYDILKTPISVPEDGLRILVGILAYTIQIYCDFSGYTDMARGLGKLMGFNTMLNFDLPYISKTPQEFWRRWHISLSTWLRDYLYIPLGGNKCSRGRLYYNVFMTMLLGGLWHGAAWTFVLWGAYHGLLQVIYKFFSIREEKKQFPWWSNVFHGIITFNLVAYGWMLFRAKNMTTVVYFTLSIITSLHGSSEAVSHLFTVIKYSWFLILFQIFQYYKKDLEPVKKLNWFVQLNIWFFIIMSILSFTGSEVQDFIYFAF